MAEVAEIKNFKKKMCMKIGGRGLISGKIDYDILSNML